ncbi:trigger factor [[Mycoplasma] testudinis]|uniref:trigger factor n=1 Tax=[Mycoplasma] testudinis TaxID=33924 RepID=UPI000489D6B6|nr:trigger factor [[Mycoplasma] testudinis]
MYKIIESQKNDTSLKILVSLEGDSWKKEVEIQIKNAIKNVSLPGFRKGKVPADKAKEHVNMLPVYEKAANKVLANNFDAIIKDKLIEDDEEVIVENPKVELKDFNENGLQVNIIFELIPVITLPELKEIPGIQKPMEVRERDINRQIHTWMKSDAEMVTKEEGVVSEGDLATIDFEGKVDGKVLPEATAQNFDLEIGSGSFIDGFEDKLIGVKKDETKVLDLKFPDDYHAVDLKGKPVSFKVTVKAIKSIKYPELNDEYVKKLTADLSLKNINNVQEFKDHVKKSLSNSIDQRIKNANNVAILNYLADNTKFNYLPESLITEQIKRLRNEIDRNLEQSKMTLEKALKMQNTTMDKFEESLRENSIKQVKFVLAVDEIAKVNKLEPTEQEIDAEIDKYLGQVLPVTEDKKADEHRINLKKQIKENSDQLNSLLTMDKVTNFLVNNQK